MSVASMKELLEAGVHFGHYTRRWNPKMRRYIFTERNGIHIIDLAKTVTALDEAAEAVRDTVAKGGVVLFVGTKKQAAEPLRASAESVGMPYVTERWLGGMMTNWRTIKQRIKYLLDLEARRDRGEFSMLPKKEALLLEREIDKLNRRLGGIKRMTELPDLVYVIDTRREEIAVREAKKLGIPIVGVVDTNCDPDGIDYVIPSNDDAIRAIKLITQKVTEAVDEGRMLRESTLMDQIRAGEEEAEIDTTQRVFDPFEDESADEDEDESEDEPEDVDAEAAADEADAADDDTDADDADADDAGGDAEEDDGDEDE